MNVGTEELRQGDGVLIPGGAPYTVSPGPEGVEFLPKNSRFEWTNLLGQDPHLALALERRAKP
jgi:hypothetical protein